MTKPKLISAISITDDVVPNGFKELEIRCLVHYKNHPYMLYDGKRKADLIESIKHNGIIHPIIVRIAEKGTYEILSGHNRVEAAKEAGFKTVPALVKDLSDDEAALIVIDSNLMQRSFADLTYRERAKSIMLYHESSKRQGYRSDLVKELNAATDETSYHDGTKLVKIKKTTEQFQISKSTLARYLRLNYLCENLLNALDENRISFVVATELSYLSLPLQEFLYSLMFEKKLRIKTSQAIKLKEFALKGSLNKELIVEILSATKTKNKSMKVVVQNDLLKKYFKEGTPEDHIHNIIDLALEKYFST